MRVIAGEFGGRTFKSPSSRATHPMSDKMRGAMFNSLNNVVGMSVLDAFAGSGGLSFEALSRGAKLAVMVEKDRSAQRAIAENIEELKLNSRAKLIRASIKSWLKTTADRFDLILLDPPYDKLQNAPLEELALRLNVDGQLVLSWPGQEELPELPGCTLMRYKSYGDGSLGYYRANSR